jgi:hypothetical protein
LNERALIAGGLACILFVVVADAGEPTDEDRAAAQDAFGKGMSQRARGDLTASLASFQRAHARLPSAITGLELGRAYMLLGRLVDARREFDAVARLPPRSGESSTAKQARAIATDLSSELAARVPTIVVEIEGARGVTLTIDGAEVPEASVDDPHEVDPGRHRVVATHAGLTSERTVEVSEGDHRVVRFVFGAHDVSSHDLARADESRHAPTWAYGALVVGGIGVGAGTIAGIVALSDRSSLGCNAGKCSSPQSDVDGLNRTATISTISWAVGLVGVGIGVYGLLAGSRSDDPPKSAFIEPWFGAGSIGLAGSF